MKRGEVWWINFDPSIGGEIKKKRPVVIISNGRPTRHCQQIKINQKIGLLTSSDMTSIEKAIKTQLELL